MVGVGLGLALRAENQVEPAVAQRLPALDLPGGRLGESVRERAEVDRLAVGAPVDRVGVARQLGIERLGALHERVPLAVEARGGVPRELAELAARVVVVEDCELRLRGTQRERLAAELHPLGEDRVLELVGLVRQLAHDDAAGAGLTQPEEPFAILPPRALLLRPQRIVLLA